MERSIFDRPQCHPECKGKLTAPLSCNKDGHESVPTNTVALLTQQIKDSKEFDAIVNNIRLTHPNLDHSPFTQHISQDLANNTGRKTR